MELRSGYKQTEVGVIPEEWEIGPLGLFWNLTDCKHVTAKFVENGIPLASIKEVQSQFVDLTTAKQTTEQYYSLLIEGGRKPQAGDLILSRNATVGEVAQVAEWHPRFALGQDVCLLRKKSQDHSSDYLQSVFQSPIITRQLDNLMVGSTFKRVNVEQVRNFIIPFPPLPEQRAIATTLSDVDALIASLDRLITKKRDMKQAAMQELLTGKRRLPGFSGEWGVKRLGEIASAEKGTQLNASDLREGGKFAHLNGGMAPSGYTDKQNTQDGTIAISEGGNSCGYVQLMAEPFWCGGHCYAIKPRGIINHFLFQALKSDEQSIMGLRVGSGLPNVQKTALLAFELHLPISQIEQTAIAAILSDMDTEIAALEQKRDKTRMMKQGMMQELLTGRIRLV